ncbi:apolipoprotein A-II [Trichomycterus rosablanca]|uniref:apolipoprotein A-II n=1 Tax=Trichomycterus rosablanca TaxID=2290929 RepID=UPI002F35D66E
MKVVLALIVALQVSVCLCEIPPPDKELVDKYEALKTVFLKRLVNAYEETVSTLGTLGEGTITGEKAKEIVQLMKENERLQAYKSLAAGVAEELQPAVEKAGLAALGAYAEYLRPYIGVYLDTAINNAKPVLDAYLPSEKH